MKTYLFIILFVFNFSVYSQETKTSELDTIRQQGYLIIGTDELGKLSDVAPKFLFIPLGNMEESLELSYTKNNQPNYNNLYIPTPYFYNNDDLFGLNIYIKKFINTETKINLNQEIVPTIDVINQCNNLYRFKENLGQLIKTFKIVYLDGIWVKLKVAKKQALPISASYNETRLNKKDNKCLDYYFLIETKAISYDILFTDNSIEIVKE
jgi:hypothetical protein